MATGWTNSISGTAMGVQIRFYYSTSYNAATNTSTVTLIPYLYTTSTTGGARGYNGSVYGNGSSIYDMAAGYAQDANLYAQSTSSSWQSFTPISGSIRTFTISHNNSGVASFTAGYNGRVRAVYDGTTASVSNATGCSASITENRSLYVSYNANGGSGAPGNTYFYGSTEGITLSSTVPTRTGYTFLGWATSSSASTASYSAGQYIGTRSSNLALYAVWKKDTFVLSIQQSTGSIVSVFKQNTQLFDGATITYGDVLTISVSSEIGYDVTGLTVNGSSFVSGSTHTVSGAVTVVSTSAVKQFNLSIVEGTGSQIIVTRTYSPLGGAALGELNDGATLYHSDVISIEVSTTAGYILQTATMNGSSIQSPYSVSADVILVATAIAAGAYIRGGSSFDMYQMLIKGQQLWDLYRPVVYNGTSWENY